jgi:hypothetical protein
MKFTIDVENFWLDGEDELEPALTKHITGSVIDQIEKSIAKKVEDHITLKVKAEIESRLYKFINLQIEHIINTEKIKVGTSCGQPPVEMSLAEYVKKEFQDKSKHNNMHDTINAQAKKFADEMKNRYDLLFASQLVAKMNNNGLLKEEVAKLLLENQVKQP